MSETKYVIQGSVGGKWVTRARPKNRADALADGYRLLESGAFVDVRVLESYYSHEKGAMSWRQLTIPLPMEVADPPPRKPKKRKKAETPASDEDPLPPPAMAATFSSSVEARAESPAESRPEAEAQDPTPQDAEISAEPVPPSPIKETVPSAAEDEFFKMMDETPRPQTAEDAPSDIDAGKKPRTLAEIRANLQAQLRKPVDAPEPPPAEPQPEPTLAPMQDMLTRDLSPAEKWEQWSRDGVATPDADEVRTPPAGDKTGDDAGEVRLPPFMADGPTAAGRGTRENIDDPLEIRVRGRRDLGGPRFDLPPMDSRRGLSEPGRQLRLGPILAIVLLLIVVAAGVGLYLGGQFPLRWPSFGSSAPPPAPSHPLGAAPASAEVVAALDVGDAATVAALLPNGGGADATDDQGVPLLLRAARQRDDAMVLLLLDLGADPKARGALRFSIFEQATIEGLTEAVALMLRKGADPNMADSIDPCASPLLRAIEQNNADIVGVLIGAGGSIKPREGCQTGPLDSARDRPAIRALIEQTTGEKPDTEPVERLMERAISRAVEDGNERTLKALLLGGISPSLDLGKIRISVNDKWGSGERSLIDHAAYHGQIGIAKELMTLGLRPSPRVLHLAIANYAGEMPGIARVLIDGGADPNAVQDGLTPLMRAAIARNADLAKRLLDKGADATAKDPQGRSAASFVGATDAELRRLLGR